MTREEYRLEQAKYYKDKGVKDPKIHFLRGMEHADSTMIDKACEWLEKNVCIGYNFSGDKNILTIIDDFRKAMKGD